MGGQWSLRQHDYRRSVFVRDLSAFRPGHSPTVLNRTFIRRVAIVCVWFIHRTALNGSANGLKCFEWNVCRWKMLGKMSLRCGGLKAGRTELCASRWSSWRAQHATVCLNTLHAVTRYDVAIATRWDCRTRKLIIWILRTFKKYRQTSKMLTSCRNKILPV